MRAIHSRLRRLQQRLCPDEGQEQRIWVTTCPGHELALDTDRCIDILRECGFLPKTRFLVLDFFRIPDGLNAKELEQYLRTNGAQLSGLGRNPQQSAPGTASQPANSSSPNQAQISAGWGG